MLNLHVHETTYTMQWDRLKNLIDVYKLRQTKSDSNFFTLVEVTEEVELLMIQVWT